jgi:hypothetical protein
MTPVTHFSPFFSDAYEKELWKINQLLESLLAAHVPAAGPGATRRAVPFAL